MTRKTYTDLQDELRVAQQYINLLIHDQVYAVVNPLAWPHEYRRVVHATRYMAAIRVEANRNPDQIKRALHIRHPGVLLIANPAPLHFAILLADRPDDYCQRVKMSLAKANILCTCVHVPSTGNLSLDTLTCIELLNLTQKESTL